VYFCPNSRPNMFLSPPFWPPAPHSYHPQPMCLRCIRCFPPKLDWRSGAHHPNTVPHTLFISVTRQAAPLSRRSIEYRSESPGDHNTLSKVRYVWSSPVEGAFPRWNRIADHETEQPRSVTSHEPLARTALRSPCARGSHVRDHHEDEDGYRAHYDAVTPRLNPSHLVTAKPGHGGTTVAKLVTGPRPATQSYR
jgi:hypothetical protein